jgi:hypothetical protein
MSLPRGSLGFLSEKAISGCGRTYDRLRRACPERGQLAVSHSEGDDRNRASDPQPLSHTKHGPSTDAGSTGHVPQRRHRGTDALDGRRVDGRAAALRRH